MSASKHTIGHTPGPWVWTGLEEDRDPQSRRIRGANGVLVVESDGISGDSCAEASANRRLIEAAPEILESLGELLTAHMWGKTDHKCGWCNGARAAIAKAEGK